MYQCAICGQAITGTDWLCADCADEYGVCDCAYDDYPDWIKEVICSERRRRYRLDRDRNLIVPLDSLLDLDYE